MADDDDEQIVEIVSSRVLGSARLGLAWLGLVRSEERPAPVQEALAGVCDLVEAFDQSDRQRAVNVNGDDTTWREEDGVITVTTDASGHDGVGGCVLSRRRQRSGAGRRAVPGGRAAVSHPRRCWATRGHRSHPRGC